MSIITRANWTGALFKRKGKSPQPPSEKGEFQWTPLFQRGAGVIYNLSCNMRAKRFETTPRGLERTEMSGLLAVRRAPAKTGQEMETSLSATPD